MLKKAVKLVILLVFLLIGMGSCTEYSKLLKSNDYDLKYVKAKEYFDDEEYLKAANLYQELIPLLRGTERSEDANYYNAYCQYHQQDYIMAGYYFSSFVSAFPNSKYTEECAFMVAYCYYKDSPIVSLDQTNTMQAIEELQGFINRYPSSERVTECNELIDELRDKLVQKSFNSAKLYFELSDFKASITALNNSLKEYPNTRFREELLFLILKSSHEYAKNSVADKIKERHEATLVAYLNLTEEFPETKHLREAERINAATRKALNLQ